MNKKLEFLFVFAMLMAAFSSVNAQSNVHVSDASGSDVNTCGASGSPCKTIQYAVDTIAVDGDTIRIDTGLYQLASTVTQHQPVVKIPEGKSLSFIGAAFGAGTRIDGDTTRRGFLYYYSGTGCQTGTANDGVSDTLLLFFKDLIIQNCHIKETCGTTSYAYGGGMRLDCDSSSEMYVTITECIFRNNRSYDVPGTFSGGRSGSGGAIWIYGRRNANTTGPSIRAEAYIRNCDFTENYVNHNFNGGHGGAILLRDLDTAAVVNSSFCDNYVYSDNADNGDLGRDRNAGGAICVYDLTSSGTSHAYHIDSCTFINNSATVAGNFTNTSEGGAIFLTKGDIPNATTNAKVYISNSNFYNNVIDTGVEHVDNNSGTIDTSNIGFNGFYNQFELSLGNDTNLCEGDTLILDASIVGGIYEWHDGFTGAVYEVTVSDTYMVTVTVGSCEVSDTIVVTVSPYPTPDLGNDTTLCPTDSLLLDPNWYTGDHTWNNGSNDSIIAVTGAGTYWVEIDLNGCIASDTIVLDTVELAKPNLGNDTLLCDNASYVLSAAQTGASYLWHSGSTASSITVNDSGIYTVTVSMATCQRSDTLHVSNGMSPVVDLGPDQVICPYDSTMLGANATGTAYLWSTGATSDSILVATEGTFWLEIDNGGCFGSDTVFIDTVYLAPVNLGPDTQLCDGQVLVLSAMQAGATYQWQDGSTNPGFQVNQAGNYAVTVTMQSCSYTDGVQVTYQSYPVVDLGPDQEICPYDWVTLDASNAGATYQWSTGSTAPSISISDEATYHVAVNLNGCWSFDTVEIDTVEIPPSFLGPNQLLCPGETYQLDASYNQAVAYLWHDGSTSTTFSGNTAQLVWVEVTVDQCTVRDSVNINYVETPLDLIGGDLSICEGESMILSIWPQGLNNYQWSTGSTQQSIEVSSGGIIWASADKQGCTFYDTIEVSIRELPVVDLGADREACDGDTIVLDVTNDNATYHWSNGNSNPIKKVRTSGLYRVTVYANGCVNHDSVLITFKPNPIPELLDDKEVCEGRTQTFNAYRQMFDSYTWSNGRTDSAITVGKTGTYWVRVGMDGCFGSDTVRLNVLPKPEVNLGRDTIICKGDEYILDATVAGNANYRWNDQSEEPTYRVWRGGIYAVTVSRAGCVARDTVRFYNRTYPDVSLGNDTTICLGDSVRYATADTIATYTWQGQYDQRWFTVNDSMQVKVMGESDCGVIYDSVMVRVRDCECFVYAPAAFTPDGDGLNELFAPALDCDVSNYLLVIYDRWGHLVFESKNPDKQWDGAGKGGPMPIGAYSWELNFDAQLRFNGSQVHHQRRGVLNLVR